MGIQDQLRVGYQPQTGMWFLPDGHRGGTAVECVAGHEMRVSSHGTAEMGSDC